MPIYEYECKTCHERFERFQSFSEPPVTTCPTCGAPVRKVLQPVGIVFKGSGWYKTDSRPASTSGTNGEASKDGADTGTAKTAGAKTGGEAKSDGVAGSSPVASGSKPAGSASGGSSGGTTPSAGAAATDTSGSSGS